MLAATVLGSAHSYIGGTSNMRPGFTCFFTASLVIAGLTATSCGGDDGNDGGLADACNPLGGGPCLPPWPSMA